LQQESPTAFQSSRVREVTVDNMVLGQESSSQCCRYNPLPFLALWKQSNFQSSLHTMVNRPWY